MKKKYIICAYREWNIQLFKEKISLLPYNFYFISDNDKLILTALKEIDPDFIFFLDWSWIVPKDIFTQYKCVVFHSAPLPEFRGGSPIQNQIIRGVKTTKLTAFLMDEGIDTGDILLQEDLSLDGHIGDIFKRIGDLSYTMIRKIIEGKYSIKKQEGKGSIFKRRKPEESELRIEDFDKSLSFIYDSIRMLEDPYPNAFIRLGSKKIIFKKVESDKNKLYVSAEIIEKEEPKDE